MVTHFRFRLYFLAVLVMAGFCLLVYRLYRIQVTDYATWSARVPGSKFESVRIPGIRGEIKDRNGLTLVDSTPTYELTSSSPIRRSISATGGTAALRETRAGSMAPRRKATPTMRGCSTSCITSRRADALASCWRMVR